MTGEPDKDVHISLEDQQKINKFARHNQRLEDIKDDLKARQSEMQTLTDAVTDIEEFQITADDDEKVPYQIGEIFIMETPDNVLTMLEKRKKELEVESKQLEDKATSVKGVMSDLKTHLYAKFGDNINLEPDD